MPTFIFYRNRQKIDRLQGADVQGLEAKIKQHYGSEGELKTKKEIKQLTLKVRERSKL